MARQCLSHLVHVVHPRKLSGMYNNKNHRVRYSFQSDPRRNHPAETPSPEDKGFLPWWFLREFLLNRIPSKCFFSPWFLELNWSNLLCLNVHLNWLSLDNHLVSNQLTCESNPNCFVSIKYLSIYPINHNGNVMWQWHHNGVIWPNRFWILLDGAKLEEIKTNDLTLFGFDAIIIY